MDGGASAHGAGRPPRRYAPPLPRGEWDVGAGTTPAASRHPLLKKGALRRRVSKAPFRRRGCRIAAGVVPRNPRPNPRPIPLLGGVPPAGGGVVSPTGRNPRPKPPSLIFDI
ncbi:MAG: hypothetical protein LBM98_01335 [Oscillospiraceae bacterium]|nr:hypothetical protein [Oscillospiraceae bacterium]